MYGLTTTTTTMHAAELVVLLIRCYHQWEFHRTHTQTLTAQTNTRTHPRSTECMHLRLRLKTFTKCSSIFSIACKFHLHLNKHTAEHTHMRTYSSPASKSCLNSSRISFNTLQINVGVRNIFVRCALLNDAKSQVTSALCVVLGCAGCRH